MAIVIEYVFEIGAGCIQYIGSPLGLAQSVCPTTLEKNEISVTHNVTIPIFILLNIFFILITYKKNKTLFSQ